MEDIHFFYLAYAIIWGGIFLFMLRVHYEQLRLAREIAVLKEVLHGRGDGS